MSLQTIPNSESSKEKFRVNLAAVIHKWKNKIPPSTSSVYRINEIPYAPPPTLYKITLHQDQSQLRRFNQKEKKYVPYVSSNPTLFLNNLLYKDNDCLKQLNPKTNLPITYLWVINEKCEFIFAPEYQVMSNHRDRCKHGDLVAHEYKNGLGSSSYLLKGRGPCRMGGELVYLPESSSWEITNASSYCFFRSDQMMITLSNVPWNTLVADLLRAYQVQCTVNGKSFVSFVDFVKKKQMDHWMSRFIRFSFQRSAFDRIREDALGNYLSQYDVNEHILKLFEGVNLPTFFCKPFVTSKFFMAEGELKISILKANHFPVKPKIAKFLENKFKRTCKVTLLGCEDMFPLLSSSDNIIGYNFETTPTKSLEFEKNENTLQVLAKDLETLVIDIFQEALHVGHVQLPLAQLESNKMQTLWLKIAPPNHFSPDIPISIPNSNEEPPSPLFFLPPSFNREFVDDDIHLLQVSLTYKSIDDDDE